MYEETKEMKMLRGKDKSLSVMAWVVVVNYKEGEVPCGRHGCVVGRKAEEELRKQRKLVRIELERRAFGRPLLNPTRMAPLLSPFSKTGNVKFLTLSKSL